MCQLVDRCGLNLDELIAYYLDCFEDNLIEKVCDIDHKAPPVICNRRQFQILPFF